MSGLALTAIFVLALALGALTTVGVSWLLAAVRTPVTLFSGRFVAEIAKPSGEGPSRLEGYLLSFQDQSRIGDRTISLMAIGEPKLGRQTLSPRPKLPREIDWFLNAPWQAELGEGTDLSSATQIVRVYGFPLPCLWYADAWNQNTPIAPEWNESRYGGYALTSLAPIAGVPRSLPLRPLWPALVANTVFFFAAWLGVFEGIARLVRLRRRRRGLCEYCTYDLRGLAPAAPCPECGTISPRPHKSLP